MTELSRQHRLLAALPADTLADLMQAAAQVDLPQHLVLHEPESSIDHVYFLAGGVVSLVRRLRNGLPVECGMVGAEGVVGASVAYGIDTAANQAIVQVPGHGIRVTKNQFIAMYDKSENMRAVVGRFVATQLSESQQLTACNAAHSAASRLCRWLLQTSDKVDASRLPLTQEFLSEMLGVQRSTVSLVENELEAAGLIKHGRGWVEIKDRPMLEATACECYHAVKKLNTRP